MAKCFKIYSMFFFKRNKTRRYNLKNIEHTMNSKLLAESGMSGIFKFSWELILSGRHVQ